MSMGVIVLNGAKIGIDSIIAAGALITEGMVVPSRSLVMGTPGRVRRMLTDDEVASIRRYSEHYVEYKNEYRSL